MDDRTRVGALAFGDPVTNICAGDKNPLRHAYFVKLHGISVQVTDKKGRFANFGREVIYPGHLPAEEAHRLFEPIWQARFGKSQVSASVTQEQK